MKSIFKFIFSRKNTKAIDKSAWSKNEDISDFSSTELGNWSLANAYEVAEISYEEFTGTVIQERRKFTMPNKPIV